MSDQPSILDTDENIQVQQQEPTIDDGEADKMQDTEVAKPTLFNPIPKTTTAWQQYYDEMGEARQKVIKRLAEQQEFHVILQPVHDPKDRDVLIKPDEKRTFKRKKISTKDFWEIEGRRSVLQEASKTNPSAVRNLMLELYQEMAMIYLADKATGKTITVEEFERIHWPVTKAILDACNLSSVGGQVPLDEQI